MRILLLPPFIITVALVPTIAQAASFTPLGDLPGGVFESRARFVSGDGSTVVGVGHGPALGGVGFIWDADHGLRTIEQIDPALADAGVGAISADGARLGGSLPISSPTKPSDFEAFLWDATSGLRLIGDLPGGSIDSRVIDMSADGSVATGRGESSTGFEAFVWDAVNGLRGLGDLPGGQTLSEPYAISTDGSTVVGYGYSDLGPEAFVWNEAGGLLGLGDLEGGEFASIATAVSADGSIVVGFSATGFGSEPFIWDPVRGMQRLGERPGRLTSRRPTAISDDGSIVVGVDYTARTGDQAVIWDATGQMQSLDILLRSLGVDMTGWKLSQAVDVSADGRTIVGYGINPSGAQEAWIAIIPEPATSSLLGIGLTLLGARRVSIRPNRAPRT